MQLFVMFLKWFTSVFLTLSQFNIFIMIIISSESDVSQPIATGYKWRLNTKLLSFFPYSFQDTYVTIFFRMDKIVFMRYLQHILCLGLLISTVGRGPTLQLRVSSIGSLRSLPQSKGIIVSKPSVLMQSRGQCSWVVCKKAADKHLKRH